MSTYLQNIIREEMIKALKEEELPLSPFTEAEEKFLAKFVELGTQSLGILYTANDVGIREFLMRSGNDFNLTPDILSKLMDDGIVSIVPYGGYARNEDYTIKCNLPLDELEGLSSGDAKPEGDDTATPDDAGAETPDLPAEPPQESISAADLSKLLVSEQKRHTSTRVYTNKSRALRRLPKGYVVYLEKIIKILGQKLHTDLEKQHLVADILDNLAHNFGLTPKQVYKSFIFYNSQNRLKNVVREQLENDEDMIKLKQLLNEAVPSNIAEQIITILSKHSNARPGIDFITKNTIVYPKTLQMIESMTDEEQIQFLNELNAFINEAPDARKKALRKGIFRIYMREKKFNIKAPAEPTFDSNTIQNIQYANQDGETFFDDDSARLKSGKEQEIRNAIKQKVDQAKESVQDGNVSAVGLAGLTIVAGTSKVPSKFQSNSYSSNNNINLAKARANEFNRVIREALAAAGVVGIDTIKNDTSTKPNEGDNWTDVERENTATYGTTGNRTKAYQDKYQKNRFASAVFNLEIISNLVILDDTPDIGGEIPGKQIYYNFISRIPTKRKRPPFKFPPFRSRYKNKLFATRGNPSNCPFFDKPGILKKFAPNMVNKTGR